MDWVGQYQVYTLFHASKTEQQLWAAQWSQ